MWPGSADIRSSPRSGATHAKESTGSGIIAGSRLRKESPCCWRGSKCARSRNWDASPGFRAVRSARAKGAALDSQWRYGVGRAARQGVVVEQSRAPGDVGEFWGLCERLSRRKGFRLPGSEALAQSIVRAPPADTVEARLFLARCEGRIGAGAIVIRCGPSLHYFWGATNRDYSRMRCGEALHWGVIEWGLGQRLETYDLEGVDPAGNDATYRFKMKMGGEVVALPVRRAYPLNALGWIAIAAARALGKL
jgi:lipid II:glycine glycyltransferase (peptidoglycan interpeptide bridge formation enzyme)